MGGAGRICRWAVLGDRRPCRASVFSVFGARVLSLPGLGPMVRLPAIVPMSASGVRARALAYVPARGRFRRARRVGRTVHPARWVVAGAPARHLSP